LTKLKRALKKRRNWAY